MSNTEPRWYPSKIDWWLVPVLCVPPVAAVSTCVASALSGSIMDLMVAIAITIFVLCLYFGVVFPMRYGIGETQLLVRSGIFIRRIPLADISEVYPTRNPLSSPALSLDRLQVKFGQGFFHAVMISPRDRNLFLDDLANQAGLKRMGERLSRPALTDA